MGGVLTGKLLDLFGLLVDNARNLSKEVVDDLLVGLVDEWRNKENRGSDESETPEWNKLDQIVRDERSKEGLSRSAICIFRTSQLRFSYSKRDKHILSEEDTL